MTLAAGALLTVVGCVPSHGPSPLENLRLLQRASFDLECAEGPLTTIVLDDKTRVVRGCGRQGTYVHLCDGPADTLMRTCVWLKNS
jgi:hypothetical protein